MRTRVLSAALGSVLVTSIAPLAQAAEVPVVPIQVTPVTPANGQTLANTKLNRVAFTATFSAPSGVRALFVEVTNQNILGQDGTLANDPQYQVGSGTLAAGDANPLQWAGPVSGVFPYTPGQYFFQFHTIGANDECGASGTICTLASQVFSFRTAREFVWSQDDALATVRRSIRLGAHREPKNLKRSCKRIGSTSFDCRVSWTDRTWSWAGLLAMSIDPDTDSVLYGFDGKRGKRSCLRSSSFTRCAKKTTFGNG